MTDEGLDDVVRTRVARVVSDLDVARSFYVALGLPVVVEFTDHDGWSGVVLGLPDRAHQLELTWHAEATPAGGGPDDLVVLWFPSRERATTVRARVGTATEAPPANPWWEERSVTVLDPDGHRITLAWD